MAMADHPGWLTGQQEKAQQVCLGLHMLLSCIFVQVELLLTLEDFCSGEGGAGVADHPGSDQAASFASIFPQVYCVIDLKSVRDPSDCLNKIFKHHLPHFT